MSRWRQAVDSLSPVQRAWLAGRLAERAGRNGILAAYVTGAGGHPTQETLTAHLEERLPPAAIPSRFVVLDALPTLPNGKVDRQALAHRAPPDTPNFSEPAPAPPEPGDRDPVLETVLAQWRELLSRPGLAPHDNVFELGAHSLQVIQCAEGLSSACGIRLPVPVVFQHPAPYDLANWIRLHRTADAATTTRHLIPVHIEGDAAPVFAVQPDFFSGVLTRALRGHRPVYALRGVGLRPEGNAGRWTTLAELADDMIREIREVQPHGPYWLSGYSFGAVIAFEVARRMTAQGLEVARLVLFDPTAWNVVHRGPLTFQLRQCPEAVTDLSTTRALGLWLWDNRPWARHAWRRLGRIALVTPYRHLLGLAAAVRRRRGASLSPRMMQADSDRERFRLYFTYRPEPTDVPTLFFNARSPDYDTATLWRPFFTGPFETCPIDAVHRELGATPETEALVAEQVRKALG